MALEASPNFNFRDSTPKRTARGEASTGDSPRATPQPRCPAPRCRMQAPPRRLGPELPAEDKQERGGVSSATTAASTAGETGSCGSFPPSPSHASASAASSNGPRTALARRDEGAQYLEYGDLPSFAAAPEERFVNDVLARLGVTDDWAEQFKAIDDARRLTRHAPKLLFTSGQLKKLVAKIAVLMESLRSALAKNALRCTGELFLVFGRKLDPEVETCLPVILRRAADTNAFIAEEAEVALREVCKAASEAKLLAQLLAGAANRRPEIRARAAWGLAMIAQRHLRGKGASKGLDLRAVAEAASKAVADASADVRLCGRFIASVLVGGNAVEDGATRAKLQASVLQGTDPASFDAFDLEAIRRAAPFAATAGAGGAGRLRSAASDGFGGRGGAAAAKAAAAATTGRASA